MKWQAVAGMIAGSGASPLPTTVRTVFFLSFAGAALLLADAVVSGVLLIETMRAHVVRSIIAASDGLMIALIVVGSVVAAAEAGLWIWVGVKARAGRNWARVTGTVFFGIYWATVILGLQIDGSIEVGDGFEEPLPNLIIRLTVCAIGLASVVLLWISPPGHFRRPRY